MILVHVPKCHTPCECRRAIQKNPQKQQTCSVQSESLRSDRKLQPGKRLWLPLDSLNRPRLFEALITRKRTDNALVHMKQSLSAQPNRYFKLKEGIKKNTRGTSNTAKHKLCQCPTSKAGQGAQHTLPTALRATRS